MSKCGGTVKRLKRLSNWVNCWNIILSRTVTMESHSGQKWSRLFLRSSLSDNKPRSHSIERDANPPFENWYWSFEICSRGSRIFLASREIFSSVEKFFSPVENYLPVENLCGQSRIFFTGREIFLSVENFFTSREIFWVGREIFLSVENFFGPSRIFLPIENFFWSVENFLGSREFLSELRIFLLVEN